MTREVASVDAAINVIVNNLNRVKELEDKLKGIEGTIEAVQALMERGVTGRATTLQTYINSTQELTKSLRAVAQEASGISKVNSELRQRILLESKLRREQSRTARLGRAFELETRGLDQTKGSLQKIKQQFDEVSKALKQAFKIQDIGLVSQLRNELSALVEDQREYNRVLAGTKNTGIDTDFLKEQARGYKLQIDQLKQRAQALTENEEIIRRLTAAEFNLVKQRTKEGTFTAFADPRLGREILANVKAQIAAEEQLARERQRASDAYLQQQKNARREVLQTVNIIAGTAKKAAGATFDALTFGQGGKVAKGVQNAAIRGGVGLGALGLGKLTAGVGTAAAATAGFMTQGPQALVGGPAIAIIEKFAQVLNSALGGIPDVVAQALASIGQIPDSLGLAAVAAFALAPAVNTAAKSVYGLGRAAGDTSFGRPAAKFLREVNPLAGAAFGSVQALQQGLDKLRGKQLDIQGVFAETDRQRRAVEAALKLPVALPAAGQTSFRGEVRQARGGAFVGGGAREIRNAEFLIGATGRIAERTEEAAATSLMFAEGLGQAAREAKSITEYLNQAQQLRRVAPETSTQRFIRENIERGRRIRQDEASAEIARERSRLLVGSSYPLSQVPARGELFPGGRTETRQPDYREMLNNAARVSQLQQEILESMTKQQGFAATLGQLERRTINDKGQSLKIQQQENEELERSIQVIRQRNRELRQRPISAMTSEERVSQGILDPASLRQSRRNRVERGRALQESRTRALSEGLIGGAFPLLFGQGIGAAVGGGAGGAAGGFMGGGFGFGLSLIGTALGTAFDTLNQAAQETGKSLNYLIEGFEKLKEANLFAGRQQEYYISKLIEAGRTAEATAEIQARMIEVVGIGGVNDLMELGDSASLLGKKWAELNYQMQALVAGPVGDFLNLLSGIVGKKIESNKMVGVGERIAALTPQQRELYRKEQAALTGAARMPFTPEGLKASEAILNKISPQTLRQAKEDPAQQEADLRKQMQVAQEIRSLQQQGADIQRSAAELRLSIEDTIYGFRRRAEDMAREGAEFRRSIEDEIFNKRQGLEQKLIENERKRQQNAIDALDLQLQQVATELDPVAQGVVDAARQYLRIRAEGEADLQQTEQQVKLELQRIDQETSRYKLQAEERIAQMVTQREEFARDVSRARTQAEYQVQDYVIKVEQYRLEMAQRRVDLALQEADGIKQAAQAAHGTGLVMGGQSVADIASRDKTPLEKALLATIRFAEGTAGPQGYRTMFGGGLFSDMSRHPNTVIRSGRYASAAAGAYQFLPGTWAMTGGGAMTPERQDAAAIYLAQRRGVDINRMGFTPQVASMLAPEWASFPTMRGGSFYGQPSKTFQQLKAYFDKALAQYSKQKPAGGEGWDFRAPAGFPGAQAPVDRYGLTIGAQAAPTSQSASAAPGIGTFVGGGGTSAAAAQAMAREMSMPIPPSPPDLSAINWPGAPELIQVNDLMERYIELQAKLKSAIEAATGIEKQRLQIQSEAARLAFEQQALAPLRQFIEQNRELEFEIQKRRTRNRLLMEGVNPEIAEGELRVLEISRSLDSALQGLEATTNTAINAELTRLGLTNSLVDSTFNLTEATLAKLIADTEDLKKQEELRQKLQDILDLKNKIAGNAQAAADTAASGARDIARQEAEPGQKIQNFIAQATAELNDLESLAIRVSQGIGDALGSSISDAITGLTAGTASAKQLFASFLADIGQILIREATKMIATYVAIGIARAFAGLAGRGAPGGSGMNFTPVDSLPSVGSFNPMPSSFAANGAYFADGVAAFANGAAFGNSIVDSPTLFQFADGGALNTGVMGEAGPEAIMPLERGPDGRLGVSAIGMREALATARSALPAGGQSSGDSAFAENREALGAVSSLERERLIERVLTSGAGSSEIKYSRVDSGDLPFVTEEDMLQASRLAAQEGARLGQQRTLAALKNNPAARRTVGM